MDYKSFHEEFIKNNKGTTAGDVLITILPSAFMSILARRFILYLGVNNIFCKFMVEYFIITLSAVLVVTIFAEFRIYWFIFSALITLYFCFQSESLKNAWSIKVHIRKKWQCISILRANVLFLSSLAILAVDFNIFPRYLAKTENFGYSFMDVGVGLFIFSNALVPPAMCRHSLYKSLEMNVIRCGILVLLGVGRTVLTKSINYQEHITEYGVHWNFFLTLAVTKIATVWIMCVFKEEHSLISGIVLLTGYEVGLNKGLRDWVMSDAHRKTFLYANREGLVSCTGYIALYLISSYIGQTVRENFDDKKQGDVVKKLSCFTIVCWIGVHLCETYFGVSRRLVNAGYCLFVLAVGTSCLLLVYIFEITEPAKTKDIRSRKNNNELSLQNNPSVMLTSINNHGLLYFLFSNLTTGLINMSFKTLLLSTTSSLFIILLYMLILPTLTVLYQKKFENKSLKNKLM